MRRSRLSRLLTRYPARLSAFVKRYRSSAQIVAGALAVGLGFWGWLINDHPVNFAGYLNSFFRTLQLITLQFPTQFNATVPWQLQIARLLLPLVAAAASFHVLVGAISRPFRLALLPHIEDHIIFCGDPRLAEAAFVNLSERGERVVVATASIDPARRDALESYGLTVVEADPEHSATWRALNVEAAAALFVIGPKDIDNMNMVMAALQENNRRGSEKPPLVLAVLIEREDLATELDAALDEIARLNRVRYHRLCPDKEGVRLELATHAPVFTKQDRDAASHVMILGLSGQWEEIVGQILLSAQDHPTKRPILTFIVKPGEASSLDKWRADKPDLDLVAEIEKIETGSHLLPDAEQAREWRLRREPPQLAVILTEDADALAIALALRRPGSDFYMGSAPVLVRQQREDRILDALAKTRISDRDHSGLVAFGGLIRADSIARVLDRKGDDLAIALHASYLEAAKDLPPDTAIALAAWDELPENLRDANRASADHAPILMASQGLVAPVDPDELSPETMGRLARIEHRRWLTERIIRGWRSGPIRDNSRRIHPAIVDFDALSAAEKEKDARAAATLIRLSARKST
jgi:RyR domain/TrkA-N domain